MSPKNQLKGKRKRAGSESSNQSALSDDQPGRTSKKCKKDGGPGGLPPKGKDYRPGKVGRPPNAYKRGDCSSDSDEPLIEVAGKVRNSKLSKSTSSSTSSLTGFVVSVENA